MNSLSETSYSMSQEPWEIKTMLLGKSRPLEQD